MDRKEFSLFTPKEARRREEMYNPKEHISSDKDVIEAGPTPLPKLKIEGPENITNLSVSRDLHHTLQSGPFTPSRSPTKN